MKKLALSVMMLSAVSAYATAFTSQAHAEWTNDGRITFIQPSPEQGGVLIGHDVLHSGSCNDNTQYFLSKSNAMYTEIQSMTTTIFLADADIRFDLSGCSSAGNPIIANVLMD